jgi:hypothetical protein
MYIKADKLNNIKQMIFYGQEKKQEKDGEGKEEEVEIGEEMEEFPDFEDDAMV